MKKCRKNTRIRRLATKACWGPTTSRLESYQSTIQICRWLCCIQSYTFFSRSNEESWGREMDRSHERKTRDTRRERDLDDHDKLGVENPAKHVRRGVPIQGMTLRKRVSAERRLRLRRHFFPRRQVWFSTRSTSCVGWKWSGHHTVGCIPISWGGKGRNLHRGTRGSCSEEIR